MHQSTQRPGVILLLEKTKSFILGPVDRSSKDNYSFRSILSFADLGTDSNQALFVAHLVLRAATSFFTGGIPGWYLA